MICSPRARKCFYILVSLVALFNIMGCAAGGCGKGSASEQHEEKLGGEERRRQE